MTMGPQWSYCAEARSCGVELASWRGDKAPETRAHFHDDDQITVVLTGARLFSVEGRDYRVVAGECLAIPAGVPHRSVPHHVPGTHCDNLYLGGEVRLGRPIVFSAGAHLAHLDFKEATVLRDQAILAASHRPFGEQNHAPEFAHRPRLGRQPIAHLAVSHGLSREGFSRIFRREFGMPPHAFRLMVRLNGARRQLRSGHTIASVAAEFGFADQSHFGRHFRNVFGVTPGAYVGGVRPSQTFQT